MDTEKINLRIAEIVSHYELSASAFADSLKVQRSSISHLLNGRNKPSLEFVTKLVLAYPEVDLYWLLYGKGEFPKKTTLETPPPTHTASPVGNPVPKTEKDIEKVLLLYTDGTFSAHKPNS